MNNKAGTLLARVATYYRELGEGLPTGHPLLTEIVDYVEQPTTGSSCIWTVKASTMNTDKYKVFGTSCNNITGSKCIKGLVLATTCKYCNRLINFKKEQKMESFKYPIALKYITGTLVVLFHEESKGVVISAGCGYKVGDYKEDWEVNVFESTELDSLSVDNSFKYPVMLKSKKPESTLQVFFHAEGKGVVIEQSDIYGKENYGRGQYTEDWRMEDFETIDNITIAEELAMRFCGNCTGKELFKCRGCREHFIKYLMETSNSTGIDTPAEFIFKKGNTNE